MSHLEITEGWQLLIISLFAAAIVSLPLAHAIQSDISQDGLAFTITIVYSVISIFVAFGILLSCYYVIRKIVSDIRHEAVESLKAELRESHIEFDEVISQ